ncbi:MAG: DHHA1 domain-containing protein, partial [Gammaproteobacteria bacterium]|nr:DHHA1 domain-containing protein [Gammaproteobacteria bacterium]
AAKQSPDIILTVDNGISSQAGVAAANECGIDVIVTDHHLPGETLPDASVIVNPNAPDNSFPSKHLAGVGVAFYVMAALGQRLAADSCISAETARSAVAECLDLVALGTVADLVPLDQNNRVLVSQGLKRIRGGRARPGLQALFAVADRSCTDAAATDLGFAIAPRLNAAGRLTDMTLGIDCLLAESFPDARRRAGHLSELNTERRELQAAMQAEAEDLLLGLEQEQVGPGGSAVCLYDAGWHQGIVGLVATRIREQLKKPVIAFAPGEDDTTLKGSGRSVQGVHMRDVLAGIDARHPGLLGRYGGHAMAAGLSLDTDKLELFRQAFAAEVELYADRIEESDRILSDGTLAAEDLNLGLAETLRFSGPWGQGFPEPLFDGRFELVSQRVVGKRHLKLTLKPKDSSATVSGIAFDQPKLDVRPNYPELNVAYRLDVNEFRGIREHQLLVVHIECV